MTEQQRVIWLLSMPACVDVNRSMLELIGVKYSTAEVNRSMLELTGVKYSTGEQNKEMSTARQQSDMKDTHTLLMALRDRSPFDDSTTLRNLMTGVHAHTKKSMLMMLKPSVNNFWPT